MEPVRLKWELHTPTEQAATWRALSNTDRFNRACGLGFQFEEAPQPDGTVHRTGRTTKFGLTLAWEELPFEIVAPESFVSTRVFTGGPLARLVTTCVLSATATGTRIDYTVDFSPRSILFRPIVAFDAHTSTRPMLDRTLKRVLASLEGRDTLDAPPALSAEADAKLQAWANGHRPRRITESVLRLIRGAPLDVQDRLRPLHLSASEGVDDDQAIAAFLSGVEAGVLQLRWELLCPSCRAPKAHAERFGEVPDEVHCTSCNIRYDPTFPDAVAVTFRPDPSIRQFELPVDCLLSPSRTPHVLAQATLQPKGEIALQIDLRPGGYRIDTHPALGCALIEVRDGLPEQDLALVLTDNGVWPRVLRVAPGPRRIAVRSKLPRARPALLTLQERWMPPHTLTAGRLLEFNVGRRLLPVDAIAPGLSVQVRRLAVVAAWGTEALPPGQVASARANGAVVHAYESLAEALAAVRTLSSRPEVGAAVAQGPVVLVDHPSGPRCMGATVDDAIAGMSAVGAGRIVLHARHKEEAATLATLEETEGLSLRDPGKFCHLQLDFGVETAERQRERVVQTQRGRSIPTHIGEQIVVKELARGPQAVVLQAHSADGSTTVVKVLSPGLAFDPEAIQRFYAEARITAGLDHPNIVRLLDWGEDREAGLFMVLEFLEGEPLSERLKRGPLSPVDVRELGLQVTSALQATHDAGVLHRDLKPANLFLMGSDPLRAKVLDFGVAHPIGVDTANGEVVLGTPEYMSPEQVDDDWLDVRSDLYAVGLVLYEACAGALPFEGKEVFVVAMQRLLRPATPLLELAPDTPVDLAEVIMCALQLDPARRFDDAAAMGDALRAAQV